VVMATCASSLSCWKHNFHQDAQQRAWATYGSETAHSRRVGGDLVAIRKDDDRILFAITDDDVEDLYIRWGLAK
jgi:hypothetical protein